MTVCEPAHHIRPGRSAAVSAVLVAALAFTGCGGGITGPAEPITQLPRALSTAEVAIIAAGNSFAVDLLGQVYEAVPDSTVFLSPLSASIALGMTMNGAAGETRDQIQTMLGFGSLTMSEVNASYQELMALLQGLDPRVELGTANAIFHRDSFQLEASFLAAVRDRFDARVEGLDFSDPASAETMNRWVRDKTRDRIENIVDPPIDSETVLFLMNAIYFNGDWTKEFDADDTYSGPFQLEDGSTESVRFMTKEDTLDFRRSISWDAVEIPYGGGAWTMTVAVPRRDYALTDLVADLGTILDPAAEWESRVLAVHIPRFELEWERVLNDDLQALGMVDAFNPFVADFTLMNRDGGLVVNKVRQKTFLKVDERGTEAAAVTSVEIGLTGAGGPMAFRADRPYLLAIRERLSGTVLFAGLIVEAPTG
jgi:serine protease inhibitor